MQFFTFAATTLFAGLAMAAPAPEADTIILRATVKFEGAAGASYSRSVPVDGHSQATDNALSISHIYVQAPNYVSCIAKGVDGSVTTVKGGQTKDVGPPQTQTSVTCSLTTA
ncbi:uncharacterized protein PG998_002177 [Apiospora kogelbergensis]|uniref:Uncharacterized protein n=1 Tax=Apiospora kogelbergensis TaxID=1337665 RepID=A0AAW0Q7Q5_9PEZI